MLFQVVPALGSVRVRTTGVAEDASVRFYGFPSLVSGLAKTHGHRIFVDQVGSSTRAEDAICSTLTPCPSHALHGMPLRGALACRCVACILRWAGKQSLPAYEKMSSSNPALCAGQACVHNLQQSCGPCCGSQSVA